MFLRTARDMALYKAGRLPQSLSIIITGRIRRIAANHLYYYLPSDTNYPRAAAAAYTLAPVYSPCRMLESCGYAVLYTCDRYRL